MATYKFWDDESWTHEPYVYKNLDTGKYYKKDGDVDDINLAEKFNMSTYKIWRSDECYQKIKIKSELNLIRKLKLEKIDGKKAR